MAIPRLLVRVLAGSAFLLTAYWLLLYFAQCAIAFPAPPIAAAPQRPPDAQVVWLQSPRGRTEAWFLPPLRAVTGPTPLLLFAHGNAELINHWPAAFAEPRHWGIAVLLVEYPGYGHSEGTSSQGSIQQTFEAAFDWAVNQPAVDSARIILYGRSLGGGAVAALSATRPAAGLVLESTFTNTTTLAAALAVPPFLVRDRFDNLGAVTRFSGPKLILHGDHDDIVPTVHGRRLAAAAGVELHLMPCGHNDCSRPWAVLQTFLRENKLLDDSVRAAI